jgi:hypothetical protein
VKNGTNIILGIRNSFTVTLEEEETNEKEKEGKEGRGEVRSGVESC